MEEKIVTKGSCHKCKQLVARSSAKRHLDKCFNLDNSQTANAFMIKIQWPHKNPVYWLYIAVPFKATLEHLDYFLRDTWLECCSHLSQFTINNKRYSADFEFDDYPDDELAMDISIEKVLSLDLKFRHEYDFGSTTELLLEVVGLTKTKASKKINIMMQNQEPEYKCSHCDEKAVFIDSYEDAFLCESCSEEDDDDENYILPLINSPRTGVCGYVG